MFRGGKPCVITPVWWDQNFMGDRAEAMGCGLRGPHFSKITGDNLAPLIYRVLQEPSFATQAARVREVILSQVPGDVAIAEKMHREILNKQTCQQDTCTNKVGSGNERKEGCTHAQGGA